MSAPPNWSRRLPGDAASACLTFVEGSRRWSALDVVWLIQALGAVSGRDTERSVTRFMAMSQRFSAGLGHGAGKSKSEIPSPALLSSPTPETLSVPIVRETGIARADTGTEPTPAKRKRVVASTDPATLSRRPVT